MPTFEQDIQNVQKEQAKVSKYTDRAGRFAADAFNFSDYIMKDVRAAREQRGVDQLSTDIGNATGQLVSGGANIRERTQGLNPLTQDALTARDRGQSLGTLATVADVNEKREGSIAEVINAGTNQIKAAVSELQAKAQAASSKASSLMEVLRVKQAEEQARFNRSLQTEQMGLDKAKFEYSKAQDAAKAGGVGTTYSTSGMDLLGNMPQYTPSASGAKSDDGNWSYNGKNWTPTEQGLTGLATQIFEEKGTKGLSAFENWLSVQAKIKDLLEPKKKTGDDIESLLNSL